MRIGGFEEYVRTAGWEKIKIVLGQYQNKYYQEFKSALQQNQDKNLSSEMTERVLLSTVMSLKRTLNNHTKNLRLLELLVFYHQII